MSSVDDAVATMLRNIPEKTGKSLVQWHTILGAASLEKHGQLVSLLKKEHGVTHGFANLIVAKFLKPDVDSGDDLIAQQYSAKADLRPIYDVLTKRISKFGKDVEFAPKKAYVSLRRKKQFGLIQPSISLFTSSAARSAPRMSPISRRIMPRMWRAPITPLT